MGNTAKRAMLIVVTISLIASMFAYSGAVAPLQASVTGLTAYTSHPTIRVNNNAELASVATAGSGTPGDPYVIGGYDIAGSNGVCIFIGNTTAHVLVRDCNLHGAGWVDRPYRFGAGVALYNVQNATVTGIGGSDNHALIYLCGSKGNTIVDNICYDNYFGIILEYSDQNVLENNTVRRNDAVGIYLFSASDHNDIRNNDCSNNGASGIYLKDNSCHNLVECNTCTFNSVTQWGILVADSSDNVVRGNTCSNNGQYGIGLLHSTANLLEGNTCSENSAHGIHLYGAWSNDVRNNTCNGNGDNGIYVTVYWDNVIQHNVLTNNTHYGIFLTGTNDNLVVGNHLAGNNRASSVYNSSSIQAFDDGSNDWNWLSAGNYWADWTTPDADHDGVVDLPYAIAGGTGADHFPMIEASAPYVTIGAPTDGAVSLEPTVVVSGLANPLYPLEVNGLHVDVQVDGSFSVPVALSEGVNYIRAVSGSEASNASDLVIITYVSTNTPSITTPYNGLVVHTPSVRVSGVADPECVLDVNGYVVKVSSNGSFSVAVPLLPGTNTITVTSTLSGAQGSTSVQVTFVDQEQLWQQELNNISQQLDSTGDLLAETRNELRETEAQLSAALNGTNARIDEVYAKLNVTIGSLGSALEHITAASAVLNATDAELNLTSGQLASAIAYLLRVGETGNGTADELAATQHLLVMTRAWLNGVSNQLTMCYGAQNLTSQEVASLLAQLSTVKASLATLQDSMDFTASSLGLTDAQLVELRNDLNATMDDLSRAETSLTTVQSGLAAAQRDLGDAKGSDALPLALGLSGLLMGALAIALSRTKGPKAP